MGVNLYDIVVWDVALKKFELEVWKPNLRACFQQLLSDRKDTVKHN